MEASRHGRNSLRRTLLVCAALAVLLWFAASPRLHGLLWNSCLLILAVWSLSLPVGALLGTFLAKIDAPGRQPLRWLLVALLFVPLVVSAAAWQAGFGYGGWATAWLGGAGGEPWLTGWRAAIWIHAAGGVPWAALLVAAALASVERPFEEQSLIDADGWRVLRRVSLRRAAGGLLAAAVWMAAIVLAEASVTDLFQVRTFAEETYVEASLGGFTGTIEPIGLRPGDFLLGVLLTAVATFAGAVLAAPFLTASASASAAVETCWTWRPSRARWAWSLAAWAVALLLAAAPLASLIWKSGLESRDQQLVFSTAKACRLLIESPWEFRREWLWSLAAGLPAALAATALGLALAWLVRLRPAMRLPMLMIVAALATVPSPLVAIGVIRLLNHPQDSPWNWLTHWYDYSLLAPVIVQTARALPLAVLLLWSQLATVPDSLLDAARSEGAGPLQRLWRVALPMRAAAVAICILVALLIAMSEVSGSLLVSPPGATLLSVRIFGLLHYGADDRVAALCLSVFVLLAALAGALAVCQRACRRRPGDRIESGEPRAVR